MTDSHSPALDVPTRDKRDVALRSARATLRVIAMCAADLKAREAATLCLADIETLVGKDD